MFAGFSESVFRISRFHVFRIIIQTRIFLLPSWRRRTADRFRGGGGRGSGDHGGEDRVGGGLRGGGVAAAGSAGAAAAATAAGVDTELSSFGLRTQNSNPHILYGSDSEKK